MTMYIQSILNGRGGWGAKKIMTCLNEHIRTNKWGHGQHHIPWTKDFTSFLRKVKYCLYGDDSLSHHVLSLKSNTLTPTHACTIPPTHPHTHPLTHTHTHYLMHLIGERKKIFKSESMQTYNYYSHSPQEWWHRTQCGWGSQRVLATASEAPRMFLRNLPGAHSTKNGC